MRGTICVLDTFLTPGACESAETLQGNTRVSQNDAGIFNWLSCFQDQTPAKSVHFKGKKHGLAGIKNFPNTKNWNYMTTVLRVPDKL